MDAGEEVSGELVIAGCDCAVLFEFIEEPLDEVTFAIEGVVAGALDRAAGGWRDDGSDSPPVERLDQAISVVGLIGEQGLEVCPFDQRLGLAEVRGLARGQREFYRVAERIDQGVDLGGQSAAGSADGLLAVFFRAPALCWWARTMVESIIMYSLSWSLANILKIRPKTPLLAHRP